MSHHKFSRGQMGCVLTALWVMLPPASFCQQLVGKGSTIVRRGAANTTANYDKDARDPNGKLMDVSVQCSPQIRYPPNQAGLTFLIGNQAGFAPPVYSANTTCIINAGGNVKTDPQPGNANHCVVNSVPLNIIKGCFH